MAKPFFSIVIPSYNQGDFLEECITSILSQDFCDFEIILMDGGSTDASFSIIEKYRTSFAYWQSCKDDGQSDALAKGFSKAQGYYLLWLNSDDVLLPNALSNYYNVLSNNKNIHFLYSNMLLLSSTGNRIGKRILTCLPPFYARLSINSGLFGFYQPSTVWSASVYHLIGGLNPDLQFAMDNDLFIRIIASIKLDSVFFLDIFASGFRVHQAQKTLNISSVGLDERSKMFLTLPHLNRYLLHLWVRLWRSACYLHSGKLFDFLGSRIANQHRKIP